MLRSLPLLTLLLAAPAAAAPVSDLKDPFHPAADRRADRRADASAATSELRDPFTRDPANQSSDPASEPSDPFPPREAASSDLRDPFARAPVVQRPGKSAAPAAPSDLRNPWASTAAAKPRRGRSHSADLRDPFAPPVQRPRRAR